MSKIGFIGLGTMGCPMAINLMQAGHDLFFFARREDVVDQFQKLGAVACPSCAKVAEAADVIVTMVTADAEVEQVVLAEDGIIAGADTGKLLIDMSTVSPATVRRIGELLSEPGMSMLDAPVSGGPSGAKKGSLSIMVGGDARDFQKAQPILEILGKKIFHLGPLGSGQTAKLVNQMMAGGIMTLIGEAMSVAKAAGLDLEQLVEVVSTSSGSSTMLSSRAQFILDNHYEAGFKTELMRKDVALSQALAHELQLSTPVTSAALQQYTSAMQQGYSKLDFSAVAKIVEPNPIEPKKSLPEK